MMSSRSGDESGETDTCLRINRYERTSVVKIDLTDNERLMDANALEQWLAVYSLGPKPDGYAAAESAAKKLEVK